MMQAALSVFVITLALGQIISTSRGWRAASLVGPSRLAGYGLGVALLAVGALFLPNNWQVLWWTILAAPLALGLLLLGGSYIGPPPQPDQLLMADLQAHSRLGPVQNLF
jgi:hypothetical protein